MHAESNKKQKRWFLPDYSIKKERTRRRSDERGTRLLTPMLVYLSTQKWPRPKSLGHPQQWTPAAPRSRVGKRRGAEKRRRPAAVWHRHHQQQQRRRRLASRRRPYASGIGCGGGAPVGRGGRGAPRTRRPFDPLLSSRPFASNHWRPSLDFKYLQMQNMR